MDKKLKAIILDLDGVLTDTALYHYKAWKEIADELNISFDEAYNENLKGISRMESLEKILELGDREYSLQEKEEMCHSKNENYKSYIKDMTAKDLLPGAEILLEELKEKGYKIGLASASKNAKAILKLLEIESYFDYIADANEIKNSKPDPEIFITCAKGLGEKPFNCLGVEDAFAGVKAIKSAGMIAIGVGDVKVLAESDIVYNSLEEFRIEEIVARYF